MRVEVAKAQAETLLEWATLWEEDGRAGTSEAAFLLRRVARQISVSVDLDIAVDVDVEPAMRNAVDQVRAG